MFFTRPLSLLTIAAILLVADFSPKIARKREEAFQGDDWRQPAGRSRRCYFEESCFPDAPTPLLCPDILPLLSDPGVPAPVPRPPAPVPEVALPRLELDPVPAPASGLVPTAPVRWPVPAVPVEPPLLGVVVPSGPEPVALDPVLESRGVPPDPAGPELDGPLCACTEAAMAASNSTVAAETMIRLAASPDACD